jgi:hypothetical protein
MEIQSTGTVIAILGMVNAIVGSIVGVLILFFRSEIRHLRDLYNIEKQTREKCETNCKEHREKIEFVLKKGG